MPHDGPLPAGGNVQVHALQDRPGGVIGKDDILEPHMAARHLQRARVRRIGRSEEHTSELQSLMRISYAVFCLKKKKTTTQHSTHSSTTTNHSNSNSTPTTNKTNSTITLT